MPKLFPGLTVKDVDDIARRYARKAGVDPDDFAPSKISRDTKTFLGLTDDQRSKMITAGVPAAEVAELEHRLIHNSTEGWDLADVTFQLLCAIARPRHGLRTGSPPDHWERLNTKTAAR
jgi:hypothetical protein